MRKGIELLLYENIAAWFDQPDIAFDDCMFILIMAEQMKFCGPLLINCGYRYRPKTELLATLDPHQLHPAELEYLRHQRDTPRSLKFSCRDIIRKYFAGRQIHRFADITNIPKILKTFLLLKPELKCI